MKNGKWKCEELKRVRAEVARANGIAWEETACEFEGECRGTCPKCEEELQRLTKMLKEKEGATIVGVAPLRNMVLAAGVGLAVSACGVGTKSAKMEGIENVPIGEEILEDKMMGAIVEKPASFPSGSVGLMKYMKENIVYPEECKRDSIEGRVFVAFMVGKDGQISDVKVVRGSHPLLDEEAERVIKCMPNWNPAEYKGEAVRSRFTFPVVFRLEKK